MPRSYRPKKMTARQLAASAYAFGKWRQQQRQLDADARRLEARDDDDTPEAIVDAMNADLLARYQRESGQR